jgi:hypothetical protein
MQNLGTETLTRRMFSEQSLQRPRMDEEDACSNKKQLLDLAANRRETIEVISDENW